MTIRKIKKNFLLALFIVGLGFTCRAEGNLPYVDQKTIHFGFLLGVNTMDFKVTPNDSARVSTLRPGFTVGIISDLRINRYLNLRFTPTLHFSERQLNFISRNAKYSGIPQDSTIQSIPFCLPIYLKYSAERYGNFRPYVIWGGGVAIDMFRDKISTELSLLNNVNFYTEFGVGCDIYFSFFKLCPELKYSVGFNDILNHNYPTQIPVEQLTSRMLTLCFNFE